MHIKPDPQTPAGTLIIQIREAIHLLLHDYRIPLAHLQADLTQILVDEQVPDVDPRD